MKMASEPEWLKHHPRLMKAIEEMKTEPTAFMTPKDLANTLRISVRTVRRLTTTGKLPPIRFNRKLRRWRRGDIDRWCSKPTCQHLLFWPNDDSPSFMRSATALAEPFFLHHAQEEVNQKQQSNRTFREETPNRRWWRGLPVCWGFKWSNGFGLQPRE
jgi:excisionase family DNA binding protein